jgi:hypothetical protein
MGGIFACLAVLMLCPAPIFAQEDAANENSGQDPANPVRRLDLRLQYQELDDDLEAAIFTPPIDWPFVLEGGWRLNTRIDVPIIINNVPSLDNVDGDWETGVSDVLTQFLFIKPLERSAFLFGSQVIFPTAEEDQFGTGKLRLLPTVGMVFYPTFMPPGSFIGGLARHDFSVAGDDDRAEIRAIELTPLVNIALPDAWFVTFAPELKIDLEQDNKVFLPFDVTVGKKVSPDTVMSLEFKHELIDEIHPYEWSLEARIGFFF